MMKRRNLLAAAAGATLLPAAARGANDRVRLGVMGVNGRGSDLIKSFLTVPGADVAAVCDVDERAMTKAAGIVEKAGRSRPALEKDIRRLLDRDDIDALVIASPDHWHAPATLMACAAGKHVYVEKPASHNAREGEWMIEAARKHRRVVQLGTQRRSSPHIREAVQRLHEGVIGKLVFARAWYTNSRPSIGKGSPAAVPAWLDFDLWQGPAPEKPYKDNLIHYNWHWFWHWGTGELGNNGIHALDLCRWGLGVDYPTYVVSAGGRYHYQDDWETPDTQTVTWDFPGKSITWEGRSCQKRGLEGSQFGVVFYGDGGSLVTDGGDYVLYDRADKEIERRQGSLRDAPHLQNFLDAVRSGMPLNAEIEEGHKSTLLCHLGNIALRTRSALHVDASNGRIQNHAAAEKLWGREYRKGWKPAI